MKRPITHYAFQEGLYQTVIFANNLDTEMFFEEDFFPGLVDDSSDILKWFSDAVDNARYYGDWNADDDHYHFGFKNGKVVNIEPGFPTANVRKNVFSEKNLLFVIWDNSAETVFWINGEEGLLALQQYTNWFDLQNMKELEWDWI